MSTNYKKSRDVPDDVIVMRLKELAIAVAGGCESQAREFTMRIPAECDRDADLVIDEAALRINLMRQQLQQAQARVAELENLVQSQERNNQELQRILNQGVTPYPPFILRKQAEAVEAAQELVSFADSIREMARACSDYAQRLHQQADEAEKDAQK